MLPDLSPALTLTLEQQFKLRQVTDGSAKMSKEQVEEMLVSSMRLLFIQENTVKLLIKGYKNV